MAKANPNRAPRNFKHGGAAKSRSPEYMVWGTMIQRCGNPKNKKYPEYGGRGIAVCERWRKSFADFLADMGNRPSNEHQIDRIDNDGNYEPSNCRWVTRRQNTQNTRHNRLVEFNGETLSLAEWSRRTGFSYDCLRERFHAGWSAADMLTVPPKVN